jgi:ABC-type molybdate transport system substrate-binding protein
MSAPHISFAQRPEFDPPWNEPPQSGVQFTVPGINNISDLYGDVNDPQLVLLFAGNQFMCVDELIASFKNDYPSCKRAFAETLPPGILARQVESGSLTVGNMRITLQPDVFAAGRQQSEQLADHFSSTVTYAKNRLAIMVHEGNPKGISGLKDLGRPDVRVSMPNPAWEGIGKIIEQACVAAGGELLRKTLMETKTQDGSTWLTHIHHRESPMRIIYGESDAAPVWYSEAFYQKMIGHPIALVQIPEKENITVDYVAGLMKKAPHPEAAKAFLRFLASDKGRDIYKRFGFMRPS